MSNGITPKLFNQVAQLGHFAGGLATIFGSKVLFGATWWALAGLAGVAALKEFWFDYKYESTEVRGSSLLDFSMYIVGGLVALGLELIKAHL